ncbi:hypothetical protein BT96DRAFT_1002542 [Gymnopus androsaceus JB14]|uniref:Uncharacterized protein n=1 Tax=Gymnopus androsaceus JB14 TaxID=1447944 RepID=A0A6A4GXU2_9AGAR|nr:hypothetical protein BT96DRAFT_1002542 [Gymnopus androsaceus JB14]
MASSANVKRKAENSLPEQPPYKAKSLTCRKPLIDIENNIDNPKAQKHDGFSIKQVAEAVRTEKSAIRMLKVSDYTNSGSALVHEVVPTVYQENRRLKAVIWVLEEALAVERTRVKQLHTKLAENHV